jgi:hypothetical protein
MEQQLTQEEIFFQLKKAATVQTFLTCPIATSYFVDYLNCEKSVENVQCYRESKDLLELCNFDKYSKIFQQNSAEQFKELMEKLAHKHNYQCKKSEQLSVLESAECHKGEKSKYFEDSSIEENIQIYSNDTMLKIQKFINKFLKEDAILSVNIDGNVRDDINDKFEILKQYRDKYIQEMKSNSGCHSTQLLLKGATNAFETSFEVLINLLLFNMTDSFSRYKLSPSYDKPFILLVSSDSNVTFRDKLLNAWNNGIVLNTDFE